MKTHSNIPLETDRLIVVDNWSTDNAIVNLPISEDQLHFIGGETVGVWLLKKFKGEEFKYSFSKYESYNSLSKLINHSHPF